MKSVFFCIVLAALVCVASANPTPASGSALNFSCRVDIRDKPAIQGLAISGTKVVLIRAVTSGLRQFGVDDILENPRLTLYASSGTPLGSGKRVADLSETEFDRLAEASAKCGAFPLARDSKDIVILMPVTGAVTCHLRRSSGGGGEVLFEAYVVPLEFYDRGTRILEEI